VTIKTSTESEDIPSFIFSILFHVRLPYFLQILSVHLVNEIEHTALNLYNCANLASCDAYPQQEGLCFFLKQEGLEAPSG
jgi:hypothetical protein